MTESATATIPRAEFAGPAMLRDHQRRLWRAQADYIACHSVFYRRLLGGARLPSHIEGLGELPFTDKAMLREDQREHPPFGSYLAAPVARISRLHRTSGTTGVAMNLALSAADAAMTARVGARAQTAAGLGPGHRVVHCLNYQLWMGGYTDHAILEETGACVVPYGVGGTVGLVRTIRELGVTAISCTPSYPAVLERVMADHYPGLSPRDLGIELGLFGGEPGLDEPAFRDRLEQTWGFKARNANYGVSDVLCNFAAQTELDSDLHFMASDVLYPELIDPESGAPLPWKEGESGELVLTHLAKECQPLLRFRTGDIISITGTGEARCGRTATRFRVVGRSDDMVVVRGLNIFPAMIGGVVGGFAELSGEYRVVLDRPPPWDRLPLEVELAHTAAADPELGARVADAVKRALGAAAAVTVLAPNTLPRTEGKSRRVLRNYQ